MAPIFRTALSQASKGIKLLKPGWSIAVAGECQERHSR